MTCPDCGKDHVWLVWAWMGIWTVDTWFCPDCGWSGVK